jgi:hypothetical protein
MTISLTAMVLEATNTLSLSVPITATVMVAQINACKRSFHRFSSAVSQVANWVGNLNSQSLYATHLDLSPVPFPRLYWNLPSKIENLKVKEVSFSLSILTPLPLSIVFAFFLCCYPPLRLYGFLSLKFYLFKDNES